MKQIKTITVAVLAIASLTLMSFTGSAFYNIIKVNWVKESHDFGEIPQGKPVSFEFAFTNTGNEPLLIANVITTCGCTASEYSAAPIAPGKSSSIKVSYNAALVGAFTKTVTVNFQDAGLNKILHIKGTVK